MEADSIPKSVTLKNENYLKALIEIMEDDPDINEVDHIDSEMISQQENLTPDSMIIKTQNSDSMILLNTFHKLAIAIQIIPKLFQQSLIILHNYRKSISSFGEYYISVAIPENENSSGDIIYNTFKFPFIGNKLWRYSFFQAPLTSILRRREDFSFFKFVERNEIWENKIEICSLTQSMLIETFESAKCVLLLNGENYTAFNIRREIFILFYNQLELESTTDNSKIQDLILCELKFISLVNLKFRKSSLSWVYRQFVFEILINHSKKMGTDSLKEFGSKLSEILTIGKFEIQEENILPYSFPITSMESMILNEFYFICKCIIKQDDNYYAWMYKIFVLKQISLIENISIRKLLLEVDILFTSYISAIFIKNPSSYFYKQSLLSAYQPLLQENEWNYLVEYEYEKTKALVGMCGINQNIINLREYLYKHMPANQ